MIRIVSVEAEFDHEYPQMCLDVRVLSRTRAGAVVKVEFACDSREEADRLLDRLREEMLQQEGGL